MAGGGTNSVGPGSFQISALGSLAAVMGPNVEIGTVSGTVPSGFSVGEVFSVLPIMPNTFILDGITFTEIEVNSFEGASFSVVPEPTVVSLLVGCLCLVGRRCRK